MPDLGPTQRPTTHRGFGRTLAATMVPASVPTERLDAPGIARGGGCSYGDQSLSSGATAWQAPTDIALDGDDLVVGGGAVLRDVLVHAWPRGRTLPVLPGSLSVTVGGAIAADVHGKNHPRVASFGQHLRELALVTPTGTHHLAPDEPGFKATIGGMGLTGVVVRARLATAPLASAWAVHATSRVTGAGAVLDALATASERHEHAAAWIDLTAGAVRAVVEGTDPAPPPDGAAPLPLPRPPRVTAPPLPLGVLNRWTVRVGNAARWRRTEDRTAVIPLVHALAPLEAVADFPRAYGPHGLVQHQVFVPDGHEDLLLDVLAAHRGAPVVPALAVLKRLGGEGLGHLSFPGAGWTLATDFPAGDRRLGTLLDELDRAVATTGGRIYLAKDAVARPEAVARMYPKLPAWRSVAATLDPEHLVTSNLDRRLGLRRPARAHDHA